MCWVPAPKASIWAARKLVNSGCRDAATRMIEKDNVHPGHEQSAPGFILHRAISMFAGSV